MEHKSLTQFSCQERYQKPRYTDDTTLMAESEEELKSLLTRVKNLAGNSTSKKTKIIASGTITSWQIEGEKMETFTNFIFLGSKITEDSDCSHEIKKKTTHTCFFVEKL